MVQTMKQVTTLLGELPVYVNKGYSVPRIYELSNLLCW